MRPSIQSFRARVWKFYESSARAMPWRVNRTPYRVFVSEIMLQQTSVARVRTKYAAFLRAFPSFGRLAAASIREVMEEWKGLGYNRRALALREGARQVVTSFGGKLPRTISVLMELPGVGHATAAAVIVYAYNEPLVFVETNVRRVFLHHFFPDQEQVPDSRIVPLVEETLDRERPREWYYALMDYGNALAKGQVNPNRRSTGYRPQPRFEGSLRQLRGRILSAITTRGRASLDEIESELGADPRMRLALDQLAGEGFLRLRAGRYSFK
ncbi:MAG: A/G-specific adenine glycosylase [Spirochaetia bacterium]